MSTPTPVPPPGPLKPPTSNATIADVEAALAAFAASAKGGESKVATWLKNEWAHLPTWTGVVLMLLKVFGKI